MPECRRSVQMKIKQKHQSDIALEFDNDPRSIGECEENIVIKICSKTLKFEEFATFWKMSTRYQMLAILTTLLWKTSVNHGKTAGLLLCDVVDEILNDPTSPNETQKWLNRHKNNRSCGMDGVPFNFYKYSHGPLLRPLTALLNFVVDTVWASCQIHKIRVVHAPGMPGTFSPPPAG